MSLVVDRHGGVVTARLNAPERLNALSSEIYEQLTELLDEIEENLEIRCLVLTGTGRAFCAGADLKERGALDEAGRWRYVRRLNKAIDRLDHTPVPVIASINGLALGGGVELMTASDMRLCVSTAKFGLPEVRLGIIPGGSLVRLTRLGLQQAVARLSFVGLPIEAGEALSMGLVDEIYESQQDLEAATASLASSIAQNAPLALRAAKKLLRGSMEAFTAAGMQLAMEIRAPLEDTEDSREGLQAFSQRRTAQFKGR